MIKQAISPLRRRMIEDMEIRGFAAKTQRGYIRAVRDFTAFLDRSPDQATAEDLRRHQLEMRSKGASATSINAAVSALRFFFSVTLGRDDARTGMTTVREPRKLPVVLSPDEVARLLDAAPGLKYKAAFSVAYGAGLRASEVVSLKLTDIDGARQVIRVEQGKGRRDRYAMLSDPKHLGARIGLTAVLHTWGAALTHHPHVHCIVPGGGLSPDGSRWIGCRPGFFLPVRVLSRLFRRLFLDKLVAAHEAGHLHFFGNHRPLADARAFAVTLSPWRKAEWVVYAKRPFAGPDAVLAYLSRYTHRIAISNSRLMAFDDNTVTFKWKDYRAKGRGRYKTMTLQAHEFIRRFLIHVLPHGFHRIRHYGLFANDGRAENLARARELLDAPVQQKEPDTVANDYNTQTLAHPCPCCGGPMVIIETFERNAQPRAPPRTEPS